MSCVHYPGHAQIVKESDAPISGRYHVKAQKRQAANYAAGAFRS